MVGETEVRGKQPDPLHPALCTCGSLRHIFFHERCDFLIQAVEKHRSQVKHARIPSVLFHPAATILWPCSEAVLEAGKQTGWFLCPHSCSTWWEPNLISRREPNLFVTQSLKCYHSHSEGLHKSSNTSWSATSLLPTTPPCHDFEVILP